MSKPPGIYDDWFVDSEIEGLRFRVDVETDELVDTADFAWITEEHIARLDQGLWEFVIVTVIPIYRDVAVTGCRASLGNVVSGFLNPGEERIGKDDLAKYPVPDLVDEAMGMLRSTKLESEIAGHLQDALDAQERADQINMLKAILAGGNNA